jgi:hypothetical protein
MGQDTRARARPSASFPSFKKIAASLPRVIAHPPGGEPLWRVSGHPREFRLIVSAAEVCGNRRLPRITQSVESTLGSRFACTGTIELQHAGSFAGAACCNNFWTDGALEQNTRGREITRQSGSPPGAGKKQPFQRVGVMRLLRNAIERGF